MNLSKLYHKETGLYSHYFSQIGAHKEGRRGLVYTRKYVWWLENKIKEQENEPIPKKKVYSTHFGKKVSIPTVLYALASQENCDGEPYDEMIAAAEYIEELEKKQL